MGIHRYEITDEQWERIKDINKGQRAFFKKILEISGINLNYDVK